MKRSYLLAFPLLFGACGDPPVDRAPDDARPRIVVTTSILGDIVGRVGGAAVDVSTLIPRGLDAHDYHYSPRDLARISDANLVFFNGGGLEEHLDRMERIAGDRSRVLAEVEGLPTGHTRNASGHRHRHGHHDPSMDPHFWTDPCHVMLWTRFIARELSVMDPGNAPLYERHAAAFLAELEALNRWIAERIQRIPEERRILVTDHYVFGHFARCHGFREGGAMVRGTSTLAQPSAREFADLLNAVEEQGIPAIFVGEGGRRVLADRLAGDQGVRVIPVYTESLSAPDGPAADYIAYMQYNVNAFVEGLGSE